MSYFYPDYFIKFENGVSFVFDNERDQRNSFSKLMRMGYIRDVNLSSDESEGIRIAGENGENPFAFKAIPNLEATQDANIMSETKKGIEIFIPEKHAIKVHTGLYITGQATVLPIPGNDFEGILKVFDTVVSYYGLAQMGCIGMPNPDKLREMINNGVCPSVAGDEVEPDGHDENGFPSWRLAMGII